MLESHIEVPWDALRYVTGFINYGGRVTDEWDRRCLINILKKICNNDVLKDNHPFSPSGAYYSMPVGSLQ